MGWEADLRSQETLPAIVNRMAKTDPHRVFVQTMDGASATWEQLQILDAGLGRPLPCVSK